MEGFRRPRRGSVLREVWCLQDKNKIKCRRKGKASAKEQVERGGTLGDVQGLREKVGMKTYLHGPMDYAKKPKLRFRVGDLDLPKRRRRYTSSREGDVDELMCLCGTRIEVGLTK